MKDNKNKKYIWFLIPSFLFFVSSLFPIISFSAGVEYELLAPIPINKTGNELVEKTTTQDYIPGLVKLIIGVAGILVVLRLIFAGIKYMSTDAFEGKSEAKGDIQNALWGFGLIIAAWLILNTINPALVNFDLKIEGLKVGDAFDTNMGSSTPTRKRLDPSQPYFEGCHDCNMIDVRVPHKGLGVGCATVNPLNNSPVAACIVNNRVNDLLYEVTTELAARGISDDDWWVTEMYPPTTDKHKSACHKPSTVGGSCVDAALKSGKNTIENVRKLLFVVKESGMQFLYEVPPARRDELLRDPFIRANFANNILGNGNAEHVHMGFWGSNATAGD